MPLILVVVLFLPTVAAAQIPIPTALQAEQPVAEPTIGPIEGGDPVDVATDGANFLITSSVVLHFISFGQYAMLVNGNAQPLWPASVLVEKDAFSASAAWNGREYLVVSGWGDGSARAARLTAAGVLLDPKPIDIKPLAQYATPPGVMAAWDGSQFVAIVIAP